MKTFALRVAFGVFFLGVGVTTRASAADFSGQWHVPGNGTITIAQAGNSLTGTLSGQPDEIWGQQKGGTLQGTVNGSTAQGTTQTGDGNTSTITLTLAPDGQSFTMAYTVTAGPLQGGSGSIVLNRAGPPAAGKCLTMAQAGQWVGPVSGKYAFQFSGNSVTGSIANLGGKYGAATITGTLSGTTITGTWKSASGSGQITMTGPDANCVVQMTYTVGNAAGPGGNETLTQAPGTTGPGNTGGPGTSTPTGPGTPAGNPWDTPDGQNCFEEMDCPGHTIVQRRRSWARLQRPQALELQQIRHYGRRHCGWAEVGGGPG